MKHPLVSAIIPVQNGERYLATAIESVLAQAYRPVELIVADDSSVDRTAEIAGRYPQVRYVAHRGTCWPETFNAGIKVATGEYIAFLSHDDLWTPDKLTVQVAYMIEHSELEYTTARAKFFLEPGCVPSPSFRMELLQGEHDTCIPETLVVRSAFMKAMGGFDPAFAMAADVDWFARAKDRGAPATVLPQVLLHKRVHDANHSMNVAGSNRDLLRLLKASIGRKRNPPPPAASSP